MESRSFEQILREKMTSSREENESFSFGTEPSASVGIDPAHLAFLLGEIPVFPLKSKGSYPKSPAPKRTRVSGTPHPFTDSQREAMTWFKENGESLLEDFSTKELKSAFRRLALRLHPDITQDSGASFLALQRHHKTLKTVFTK